MTWNAPDGVLALISYPSSVTLDQLGVTDSFVSLRHVMIVAAIVALAVCAGLVALWRAVRWNQQLSEAFEAHGRTLTNERNLLRSLIDALPDNIFIKDVDGKYIMDNIAHTRFLGLAAPADVVGKSVFDFFPADIAQHFHDDDMTVLNSGQPLVAREERITKQGKPAWVSTTKVPLRDGDGKTIGLVCITRDITARKEAEESQARLRQFFNTIVENIPNMIFVKDAADLRFVLFNRAGELLLKCPREQLIGKSDYDMFPKDEADFFTTKDRGVLATGSMLDIPEEPIKAGDEIRYLHTKKIPITVDGGGESQYLLGISEDITDRKRADEELREKNRLLEEAIRSEQEAHAALKQAQVRMVQSEKLVSLGRLVAGVAHEINNPLAFVTNNVVVLQRDLAALNDLLQMYQAAETAMTERDSELAKRIADLSERIDLPYTIQNIPGLLARSRDGLKRIQEIVKDLRDFSRQESVGTDQPDVDLNPGIQSTVNIVRGRAIKQKVEVVLDLAPLPHVSCAPSRINQVVLNLVVNAIDACPEGGTVTVRTRPAEGGIEFSVSDTGTGIPPALRDKIFDPFFTTKPQGQGTGLGLSVSHGIIEEHGGRIDVTSTLGMGSTFTVCLPKRPPAKATRGRAAVEQKSTTDGLGANSSS